jgi:hypothetical protein
MDAAVVHLTVMIKRARLEAGHILPKHDGASLNRLCAGSVYLSQGRGEFPTPRQPDLIALQRARPSTTSSMSRTSG